MQRMLTFSLFLFPLLQMTLGTNQCPEFVAGGPRPPG
jgi:hypothetical protein